MDAISSLFPDAVAYDSIAQEKFKISEISIVITEEDRKICAPFLQQPNFKFPQPAKQQSDGSGKRKKPLAGVRSISSNDLSDSEKPLKKRKRSLIIPVEKEEKALSSDEEYDFEKVPTDGFVTLGDKHDKLDPKVKAKEWKIGTFLIRLKDVFKRNSEEIKENCPVWQIKDTFMLEKYQRVIVKGASNDEHVLLKRSMLAAFAVEYWWEYLQVEVLSRDPKSPALRKFPTGVLIRYPSKEELDKAKEIMIEQEAISASKESDSAVGQDRCLMMFTRGFMSPKRPVLAEKQKKIEEQEIDKLKHETTLNDCLQWFIQKQADDCMGTEREDCEKKELLRTMEENCTNASEAIVCAVNKETSDIWDSCEFYARLVMKEDGEPKTKKPKLVCCNCMRICKRAIVAEFSQPLRVTKWPLDVESRKGVPYYKVYSLCNLCAGSVKDSHMLQNFVFLLEDAIHRKFAQSSMEKLVKEENWLDSVMKMEEIRKLERRALLLWNKYLISSDF